MAFHLRSLKWQGTSWLSMRGARAQAAAGRVGAATAKATATVVETAVRYCLCSLLALLSFSVFSESSYPVHPIKIISPFGVGTVSDQTLRLVGKRMGQKLNTQVVIENQTGAGGISAAKAVLMAPHDGYTLAMLSSATAMSAAVYKNLPFQPTADFIPVASLSAFASILVSNRNSNIQSFQNFVTLAKAKPGQLNVGTTTAGNSAHLTATLLKSMTGLNFMIVPYKGPAELLMAIKRQEVDVIVQPFGAFRSALQQKELTALALTSLSRGINSPDIPTLDELGVTGFDVSTWNGLFAPLQTPAPAIQLLSTTVGAILLEPETIERFKEMALEPEKMTPQELGERMKQDVQKWTHLLEVAGIPRQ